MVKKLNLIPIWAQKSLQGITYWVGHRRCLYDRYPLGESAFIAELCNLIYAHLANEQTLRCEVMYSELFKESPLPDIFGPRARADIVISRTIVNREPAIPEFIIEVKRGKSPRYQIDNDLKRLAEFKKARPACRSMLFVVSEAYRPERFVNAKGMTITGIGKIPDYPNSHYRVRRTAKAAHAFTKREKATYASLLEVFNGKPGVGSSSASLMLRANTKSSQKHRL